MNGACLKSAISISAMLVFSGFSDLESKLDSAWWDADEMFSDHHESPGVFLLRVGLCGYALSSLPLALTKWFGPSRGMQPKMRTPHTSGEAGILATWHFTTPR